MDERYQASADGTAGGAVADGADGRVVAGTVAAVVVEAPVDRGARFRMGRRRFRRVDLDGRLRLHACAGKNRENIQRRGGADSGNLFQEKNLLPKYPAPVCPGPVDSFGRNFLIYTESFTGRVSCPANKGRLEALSTMA